jgi:transposase
MLVQEVLSRNLRDRRAIARYGGLTGSPDESGKKRREKGSDSAYAGSIFHTALTKVLPNLGTEIVKRSDRAKGFVPLPKRWIVERTIAWLNRCRRLAKDWENLNRNALAFLKLASIRLMLRKLCNP